MPEKLVSGEAGRQVSGDAYDSGSRRVAGRRRDEGRDDVTERRTSRGRRVAGRLVAGLSTAAAAAATSAAAWRRPAGGSTSTNFDDSGFASTEHGRVPAGDHDATSSSTTAMSSSSPVDWLDVVDRVPPSGAVGITNHHNTCFISAVVQCLSNTPAFVLHALLDAAAV